MYERMSQPLASVEPMSSITSFAFGAIPSFRLAGVMPVSSPAADEEVAVPCPIEPLKQKTSPESLIAFGSPPVNGSTPTRPLIGRDRITFPRVVSVTFLIDVGPRPRG